MMKEKVFHSKNNFVRNDDIQLYYIEPLWVGRLQQNLFQIQNLKMHRMDIKCKNMNCVFNQCMTKKKKITLYGLIMSVI